MATALLLLPLIAPHARPPQSYRPGGERPRFLRVSSPEVARTAAEEALLLDAGEGAVAIVAPLGLLAELRTMLERAAIESDESTVEELAPAVRLLGAREAKGLEFDHVLVVEPAAMAEEAAGVQGLRHLYVALTRPTKTLTVIYSRKLPGPLGREPQTTNSTRTGSENAPAASARRSSSPTAARPSSP
jgi:superfamily I DNA/RNA helicase